jgi:hypothetical protein
LKRTEDAFCQQPIRYWNYILHQNPHQEKDGIYRRVKKPEKQDGGKDFEKKE